MEKLAEEIIHHPGFGLKDRKRPKDLMRFKFYKLALGIKFIMALSRLYDQISSSKDDLQMSWPFSPTRLAAGHG